MSIYVLKVDDLAMRRDTGKEGFLMDKTEAISLAQSESRKANGERRYAVKWPDGHWTVELRKPSLAGECLLAVDGVLEHA